jgi:glycosyltransferase involved in cell wall biosynthesis
MRVGLLTANAKAGDAIGNQVAEKLSFFLDRGADVFVFADSNQRLHPFVAPYCRALDPERPGGESWAFLTAADLVVVDYSQHYPLLGVLPMLIGGKPRIVFDYHGVTPPELWKAHNREALEKGVRQRGLVWCADAALVHSRFTAHELFDATSFPKERQHRLAYPIDTDRFCAGRPRRDLRDDLGLGEARILLFVGRLAPNKRLLVLVQALPHLRELAPPAHAVVIGDASDTYESEARSCRETAVQLGVGDRLHILGQVGDQELLDAYRSADVFVMPSIHEGFCIPVVEAMACGVPVVAARAGALPETVGNAGLSFTPDDAEDLARQLRRVLESRRKVCREQWAVDEKVGSGQWAVDSGNGAVDSQERVSVAPSSLTTAHCSLATRLRIAMAAFRYGKDFVGGAETSLRTAARALKDRGHVVEVFTTCTKSECYWSDQFSEGMIEVDEIAVHRFRIDSHDRSRHLETVRRILQADGPLSPEAEEEYLRHSIHSTGLIEELRRRQNQFDAIIVGPYLHGLTCDVAQEFPAKTLVMPCFHDEPFARLRKWLKVYAQVGGILYHSPEEQEFAQGEIGLNHPGGTFMGSVVDTEMMGNAEHGQELAGKSRRYLVNCGRYSPEKNLPLLLDYAQQYSRERAERFTFLFLGEGGIAIPKEPWARDLGFVDESVKRDVLAGASALVQLSRNESLSLVALEAWVQGIPVLANSGCAVLAGHLRRCGAGQAVDSYESFVAALDDLWANPAAWQARGRQGREYVRGTFGSHQAYANRLEEAIRKMKVPLAERMCRQGLERARTCARSVWRDRFGAIVEEVLDSPSRAYREEVEIKPRGEVRRANPGQQTVLVPVRVLNRGTHTLAAEGPGRKTLQSWITNETGPSGNAEELTTAQTALPDLLMPGRALPAVVPICVPNRTGTYQVLFGVGDASATKTGQPKPRGLYTAGAMHLLVEKDFPQNDEPLCTPMLELIQTALAEAQRLQRLPDDYLDVTEGWFARWKRWIKRKLLGNFKNAYVDVLSRQQSAFNRQILTGLLELAECVATFQHALQANINKRRAPENLREEIGNRPGENDIIKLKK